MGSFKERLEEALSKANMNQEMLSLKTNINKGLITQWKNGKAKPKIENARKMAEVLGCDPDWLRGEDVDPKETKLLKNFKKLNELGKDKANEYIEDLTENEKYTKKEPEYILKRA